MSLVLVTGISTSGKSAVAQELTKRGYAAYDTEHDRISAWFNKKTGERDAEFGQVPERTKEWLNQHEWLIDIDWVKAKATVADDKTIFLCGGGANEPIVRELCSQVIWLVTDEATIRSRVGNPRDHTYGTLPHELELILASNIEKEAEYRAYGATMIDATQSLDMVVGEILHKLVL